MTANIKDYPELYEDNDIEELVNKYHKECFDEDCSECEEGEDCETVVLCDLWRKWKNAKRGVKMKKAFNDLYYELVIDKMGYPKDGKYYRNFSEEESACIRGVLELVRERINNIYGE